MAELKWRVEDRRHSKTAQPPLLAGQKYGKGLLIPVAWTPYKSNIDADRWYSFTYLHPNKFSGRQDRRLSLMVSRLQNRTIAYR